MRHGHIAPPGGEAEPLAPLPVAALDCDDKILRALRRAGLKTIGQVAARDRSELAARFGKELCRATGRSCWARKNSRSIRAAPLPDLMAEQRFAEPIVTAGRHRRFAARPGAMP